MTSPEISAIFLFVSLLPMSGLMIWSQGTSGRAQEAEIPGTVYSTGVQVDCER